MDKSSFSNNLAHIGEFSLEDKLEIMAEKNRYPYCAPLQMLDLLSDKAVALYHWEDVYKPGVMLHVPEPQVVETLLEQVKPTAVDSASDKQLFEQIAKLKAEYASHAKVDVAEAEPTAPAEPAAAEPAAAGDQVDVMREINDYEEVSFKTAPKSEILSKFLEVGSINVEEEEQEDVPPVDVLAKKSIADGGTVETETLAQIYEKQGKFERAIAAYERLMERHPEKHDEFAKRIDNLLDMLANKKK